MPTLRRRFATLRHDQAKTPLFKPALRLPIERAHDCKLQILFTKTDRRGRYFEFMRNSFPRAYRSMIYAARGREHGPPCQGPCTAAKCRVAESVGISLGRLNGARCPGMNGLTETALRATPHVDHTDSSSTVARRLEVAPGSSASTRPPMESEVGRHRRKKTSPGRLVRGDNARHHLP